ncbi:hypothetical protein RI835_004126 [Providencia rettgeri]|nr:hypothetical protein [Providencia rettgeri]
MKIKYVFYFLLFTSFSSFSIVKEYEVSLSNNEYSVSSVDPDTGFFSSSFDGEYDYNPTSGYNCYLGQSFDITTKFMREVFSLPISNPGSSTPYASVIFSKKATCLVDWLEDKPDYKISDTAKSVKLKFTYRAFFCPKKSIYTRNNLNSDSGCPVIDGGSMHEYCIKQPVLLSTSVANPSKDGNDYVFNSADNGCKYISAGDVVMKFDNPYRVLADWVPFGVADLSSNDSYIYGTGEGGCTDPNGCESGGNEGGGNEGGGNEGGGNEGGGNEGGGNEGGGNEGGGNEGSDNGEYSGVLKTIRSDTNSINTNTSNISKNSNVISNNTTKISSNTSSIKDSASSIDNRLKNIDGNISKIERYLRPEEKNNQEWIDYFDNSFGSSFSPILDNKSIFSSEMGYRNTHEYSLYSSIASSSANSNFVNSFSSSYAEQLSGLTSGLPSDLQLSHIASKIDGNINSSEINFGGNFKAYGTFTSLFGIDKFSNSIFDILPKYKVCEPLYFFSGKPYEFIIDCILIERIRDVLYYVLLLYTLWFSFVNITRSLHAEPSKG